MLVELQAWPLDEKGINDCNDMVAGKSWRLKPIRARAATVSNLRLIILSHHPCLLAHHLAFHEQ